MLHHVQHQRDYCRNCKGKACCSYDLLVFDNLARKFLESEDEEGMDEPFGHLRKKEKQRHEMLQRGNLTSSKEKERWSKIKD